MFIAIKPLLKALAIVLFLCACQNKSKNEEKINQQLIQSFNESNSSTMRSTSMLLKALEDMSMDPLTSERAAQWFKKAVQIDEYTVSLYRLVDSAAKKPSPEKDIEAVYKKIVAYKSAVFQTDNEIAETFIDHFNFINSYFYLLGWDTTSNKPLNSGIPKEKTVLLLESLKTKSMILENKFVSFCFQKVPPNNCGFDTYSSIVTQNAEVLSPGANLEITTGIGALSKAAKPVILIGGNVIPLSEDGLARIRKKVSDTPGTYKLPVTVFYYNFALGKQDTAKVNVTYKVAKLCE